MVSIVPKAAYPNVPDLPGVPALPRSPNFPPVAASVLGLIEGTIWQALTAAPVWGIYQSGAGASSTFFDRLKAALPQIGVAGFILNPSSGTPGLVAQADSVIDLGYRNENRISSFPVQAGSFANYNKVNNPYEVMVRMTRGGTVADRTSFLSAIDSASKSLDLYDVVTPEKTYTNANIQGYSYRREARNGANLMIVDLILIEIRQVQPLYSTASTANSSLSAAVPSTNVGKVQATAPSQSLLSKGADALKKWLAQ